MYDPTNPYASPMATEMDPIAVQWLGTPSPSLTRVANGLGMIYAGIVVALLAGIGGGILFGVLVAGQNLEAAQLVGFLIFAGTIIAWILNIVGNLFCLATPAETGAQGMIYASVASMGINLIITVGVWLKIMPDGARNVQLLFGLISGVTFLIFLRRLALFIGRLDLANRARSILIWCAGLFLALVAALAIMIGSAGFAAFQAAAKGRAAELGNAAGGVATGGFMILVILIAALITFVRYANLLTYLRKAILSGGRG